MSPADAHRCDIPAEAAGALGLPRDAEGGPVFNEPWEAQAFAMAVALHQKGVFTWEEWATALGGQIHAPGGDAIPYYEHWMAALEALVAQKRLFEAGALEERQEAWRRAAAATPHGQPILLA